MSNLMEINTELEVEYINNITIDIGNYSKIGDNDI